MNPRPSATSKLTDAEMRPLVQAAARGDVAAKRQLVERTVPVVHGMLTRLVGRRPEVEDLAQMVFMRMFRSLSTFRGESAFTTWVCTICVNVSSTFWSDKKSQRETSIDGPQLTLVAQQGDAHDVMMAREGLRQVSQALDGMSATLRSAFVLHVFEGYDVETVAAMTSSTVSATYKAIERARKHIETAAEKSPYLSHYLNGRAS